MEVFKKIGSKERFYEIMSGVNKIKLNEDVMGSEGGLADKAVQELLSGSLDIEQINNQVNGNESTVEIVGKNDIGSKFIFKFIVSSNETDQQGVNVINDADIVELVGEMPKYDAKFQMGRDDSVIAEINKNYKTQLIDAISEYVEFESDAETVSDEMYEEAVKLIDRVPYNKGSEEIQTHKAYADQKPTNPNVRVKSNELDSFVSEDINSILHYSQAARDSGMLYPQAKSMGVTNQYILKDALGDVGIEIINIVDIGDKYQISFEFNETTQSAKLKKNYGSAAKVRDILKKKLGINEENEYVDDEYTQGSEEDILALPPEYSAADLLKSKSDDDGTKGIDPWEQEMAADDDGEPVEQVSPERAVIINKAYENLIAAGNQAPTLPQIMAEIDKLEGKVKPVQKTRTIPRGAEEFWEGYVVTDIKADDVVKQSYDSLSNEKKNQLIFKAQQLVDEALGSSKDRLPRQEYLKNVQKEAIKLHKESFLNMDAGMDMGVNEDGKKSDYPTPLGKSFVIDSPYPEKKKKYSKKVKIKEDDDTPEPAIEPDFDAMGMGQEDQLGGGLGDDKSPNQFDPDQVAKGVKVEMEHTDNPLLAMEIALDHLTEDPEYYGGAGDDPEEMAQTNASHHDEDNNEDDELTDELLGYKPHNVGDYANEGIFNPHEYSDNEFDDDEEAEYNDYHNKSQEPEDANKYIVIYDGSSAYVEDGNNVPEDVMMGDDEVVRVIGHYNNIDDAQAFADKYNDSAYAITEEQVKLARQVLKNRRLNEGMTKTDAVQLLIRHNIK